jgi:hypothetical protein
MILGRFDPTCSRSLNLPVKEMKEISGKAQKSLS